MTKYELVNKNIDVIVKLIKNDLTTAKVVRDLEIFETFHSLQGRKTERYHKLSRQFGISTRMIIKIVGNLNKTIR
jgi:hypothetical protein